MTMAIRKKAGFTSRWRLGMWGGSLLTAALLAATATAQAPRHRPAPQSLWAYQARHVQRTSAQELWGDVYCSGGSMCFHHSGCGPLHSIGKALLHTLDCLLPCTHCGSTSGCAHVARPAPRRHCCLPRIPSVRFHAPCEPRRSCCDRPMVMEGEPMLIEPPVPQPTPEPSRAPNKSARSRLHKRAVPVTAKLAQPKLLKPTKAVSTRVAAKAPKTLKAVSFERLVKKSRPEDDDDIPTNPLRSSKRR